MRTSIPLDYVTAPLWTNFSSFFLIGQSRRPFTLASGMGKLYADIFDQRTKTVNSALIWMITWMSMELLMMGNCVRASEQAFTMKGM